MAERLAAAQRADHRVLIPAVILAEVATGAPSDAAIWQILGTIPTVDLPQSVAMRAGALRTRAEKVRRKKRDLTVDAIVAATAVELAPSVVITADSPTWSSWSTDSTSRSRHSERDSHVLTHVLPAV